MRLLDKTEGASFGAAIFSFICSLTLNDVAMLVGILTAIITALCTLHRRLEERREHRMRMRKLSGECGIDDEDQ
jgi:hypothetical protein